MTGNGDRPPAGISGGRLADIAIRRPVTVCMVFVLLMVMGVIALWRIPLMLVPSFDAPVMFVNAEYANATPAQVLESITTPIEEALATVPGIKRMNSMSSASGMRLQIWCGMGADTSMLRMAIRDKLDQIRDDLPEDLRQVDVRNFSTDEIPILEGTLTAERDLSQDFDFIDTRVSKPLMRIPGVGDVELWGTDRRQVEIYLRMDDIKRHKVDVGALYQAINGSALDLSLGRVTDGGRRFTAISKGALDSVDAIAGFPVGQRGILLSDVADVVLSQRPRNSGRHQNGVQAVGLSIQKTGEANTVEVVDRILDQFEVWSADPTMDGLEARWWHNAGEEIENGLGELVRAGIIGAILAVAVLFAFLRQLRASLAIGLAIHFSLVTAICLLYFSGGSLNVLSMMGLMLAAGMLVDNAVVVLEAILQKAEHGCTARSACRQGASEVSLAVVAATSTTMIVFIPLLFEEESQIAIMLSHAGISIIFALLCSLFISLTLIPLAASRLLSLKKGLRPAVEGESRIWGSLAGITGRAAQNVSSGRGRDSGMSRIERYLRVVDWHLDNRHFVGMIGVPAVLGLAGWALLEVVPDNSPDESASANLRIEYDFSENYHYAKIERDFVTPVEEFLHGNADRFRLKSTSSAFGNNWAWTRAYLQAEDISPDEIGDIRRQVGELLPVIPGARIELGQEGGGARNFISANIYGEDPSELIRLVETARERLLEIEGFNEVYFARSGTRDEVSVRLRRDLARRYDISPQSVSRVLGLTVRSQRMRNFRTPEGEVELWIGLDPADMQSVEDLESLVVGTSPGGRQVLLGNVADLSLDRVVGSLHREDRRTFAEINAVYRGSQVDEGREAFDEVLNGLPYEPGYRWSKGFFSARQDQDTQDFVFSMLLALMMVYFVMAALFESLLHPFAIMLAMPFSVVGIVAFLLLTGTAFSVMAQVGLLILNGIVVNNGIVLINHINHLRRQGLGRRSAILTGCEERLRPICMTAATTIVGLVPLAVGDAGLAGMSYYPLARTVMGGLMAATVLTLVVLPTYYVLLDDFGFWLRRLWRISNPRRTALQKATGD